MLAKRSTGTMNLLQSLLSGFLCTRYGRTGVLEDLEHSMELGEDVRTISTDDPNAQQERPSILSCMGTNLPERFERVGLLDVFDKEIQADEEEVVATLPVHLD